MTLEKEKVGLEETQHSGASLIRGQGLAGKETVPTGKTEASDQLWCLQSNPLLPRVFK